MIENLKRKLTAILSADVKGFSRLVGEDEEGTIRTLKAYIESIAGRDLTGIIKKVIDFKS